MKSQVVAIILTYLAGSAIAAPTRTNGRDIDSLQAAAKHVAVENKVVNEIFDKFMGSVTKRDENDGSAGGTVDDDATGIFSGLAGTPTPTPTPLSAVTGSLNSVTSNGNPVDGVTNTLGGVTGSGNPLNAVTGTLGGVTGGGNPLNAVTGQLGGVTGDSNPLNAVTGQLGGLTGDSNPLNAVTGQLGGITGSSNPLTSVTNGITSSGPSPLDSLTAAINSLAQQATPILGLITGLVIPLLQGLLQGLAGLSSVGKRDAIVNFGREDLAKLGVSASDIDMLESTLRTPLRVRDDSPAFVPGRLTDYGLPKDVATKLLAAGPTKVFAAVMALTEKGPDGKLQFSADKLKKLGYSAQEIQALTKSDPVTALTAVTQLSNDTKSGALTEQLQMLSPVTEALTGSNGGKGDTLSQLGNIAEGATKSLEDGFGGSVSSGLESIFSSLGKGFSNGQSGGTGVTSKPAAAAQPKSNDVILLLQGLGSQLGAPSKRAVPANNKMLALFSDVQKEAMAMGRTFATYLKYADDGSLVFDEKKVDPNGADVKQFYAPESTDVMVRLMNQILTATGNKVPTAENKPTKRDTLPFLSGSLTGNGQRRDSGSIVGNLVTSLLAGMKSHAKRSTPDPTKDISYNMNDPDFPKNIPQADLPQAKPGAKPDAVGQALGLVLAAIGAHKRAVTPDPTKDISYNMNDPDFPKNIPQADLPQAKPGAKPDAVGQALGLVLAAIGAHKRQVGGSGSSDFPASVDGDKPSGLSGVFPSGVDGDFPSAVDGDIPKDGAFPGIPAGLNGLPTGVPKLPGLGKRDVNDIIPGVPLTADQLQPSGGLITTLVDVLRGIIDGKSSKVPPAVLTAALNGDTDALIAYGSQPEGGLVGALKGLLSG